MASTQSGAQRRGPERLLGAHVSSPGGVILTATDNVGGFAVRDRRSRCSHRVARTDSERRSSGFACTGIRIGHQTRTLPPMMFRCPRAEPSRPMQPHLFPTSSVCGSAATGRSPAPAAEIADVVAPLARERSAARLLSHAIVGTSAGYRDNRRGHRGTLDAIRPLNQRSVGIEGTRRPGTQPSGIELDGHITLGLLDLERDRCHRGYRR